MAGGDAAGGYIGVAVRGSVAVGVEAEDLVVVAVGSEGSAEAGGLVVAVLEEGSDARFGGSSGRCFSCSV